MSGLLKIAPDSSNAEFDTLEPVGTNWDINGTTDPAVVE